MFFSSGFLLSDFVMTVSDFGLRTLDLRLCVQKFFRAWGWWVLATFMVA